MLTYGEKFSKHSGVRAAVHRSMVKTGRVDESYGRFYDVIFDSRQRGDYQELDEFSSEQADELMMQSEKFVNVLETLLESCPPK